MLCTLEKKTYYSPEGIVCNNFVLFSKPPMNWSRVCYGLLYIAIRAKVPSLDMADRLPVPNIKYTYLYIQPMNHCLYISLIGKYSEKFYCLFCFSIFLYQ